MHNSVVKNNENVKQQKVTKETTENVVEFVARHQIIAQEAEDACNLEGNLNCPDYDIFEEKYGLGCFA